MRGASNVVFLAAVPDPTGATATLVQIGVFETNGSLVTNYAIERPFLGLRPGLTRDGAHWHMPAGDGEEVFHTIIQTQEVWRVPGLIRPPVQSAVAGFFVTSEAGRLNIWNATARTLVATKDNLAVGVVSPIVSPDGRYVAAIDGVRGVTIYSAAEFSVRVEKRLNDLVLTWNHGHSGRFSLESTSGLMTWLSRPVAETNTVTIPISLEKRSEFFRVRAEQAPVVF
jgi:hypothetical protein